jgi:hypothetical protein
MDAEKDKPTNTVKIVIFVVVIACLLIVIYYIFCYYASDDDDGFLGSGNSAISVDWNIEDMVNKIHNRQKVNLSRISKDSHYNI